MINSGSYLVLCCLTVVIIFGLVGLMFVYIYMRELKHLIQRKYEEESYVNGIKRFQRKFGTIYGALQEKRDDPSYKQTVIDLEMYQFVDLDKMTHQEIKNMHQEMTKMDQKMPEIDDVEDMLSAVKFEQPAAQRLMDTKINELVNKRSEMSLDQIGLLIKKRLTLFSLFMLQDNFELSTVKMKAEMHIQNEKLEFLFKTLAERGERRTQRKQLK